MSRLWSHVLAIFETLRDSLLDPASNPLGAVFGLAIVILVLLVLVIFMYLLVTTRPWNDQRESDQTPEGDLESAAPPASSQMRRGTVVVSVLILAGSVVGSLGYTSHDDFCQRCHYTARAYKTLAEGPHAEVSCRACHEAGGAAGYLDAKSRGVHNALRLALGSTRTGPLPTTVSDDACMGCHASVARGASVVARSIRVRHSDIIEAGYACTYCHSGEAHGSSVARVRYPEMRYCLVCHDGNQASTECVTCHPGDTGTAVRRARRAFKKVDVPVESCRGCHEVETCNKCHGLELPHSRKFVEGYHALKAYRSKDVCLKCHDFERFCNTGNCHNFRAGLLDESGLRAVAEEHGPTFAASHSSSQPKDCELCHATPNLCEFCHGDVPDH